MEDDFLIEYAKNYEKMYGTLYITTESGKRYLSERMFAANEVEWKRIFGPLNDYQVLALKRVNVRGW